MSSVGAFIAGLLTGGVIGTVFMGLFQISKGEDYDDCDRR